MTAPAPAPSVPAAARSAPRAPGERAPRPIRDGWLLSARGDLAVFAGPVLLAAALIGVGFALGLPKDALPLWAYALLVVGCDVAHVHATAFRAWLDPDQRALRPGLLLGVPLLCFLVGLALHAQGPLVFWRALAYLAAFHFVRQQVGWMVYVARQGGERVRWRLALDKAAIYAATLFPLLWWHAHLPKTFVWFVPGDFAPGVPTVAAVVGLGLHVAILGAWLAVCAADAVRGRGVNRARVLVLATTWLAWVGGIVLLESDLAFTATNVLLHAVPYAAVVHRWGRNRFAASTGPVASVFRPRRAWLFAALLVGAAFVEEGLWDRLVWHEHGALFPGPDVDLTAALLSVVVALLAVPQAAHYVLDAFLWRTGPGRNPGLAEYLRLVPAGPRRDSTPEGGIRTAVR